MTYRPLPKEVTIKQSGIEGLGLFKRRYKISYRFRTNTYC